MLRVVENPGLGEANVVPIERANGKPLKGLTILLVEDSRFFAEAMRLLAVRSGARIRRADCIASAHNHLRIYTPDVILVDLGLPDGSGVDLISELNRKDKSLAYKPAIIAISGLPGGALRVAALEKGAELFLEKPVFDLRKFQEVILSVLPDHSPEQDQIARRTRGGILPDIDTLEEDYRAIETLLREAGPGEDKCRLQYCAEFLHSVARVAQDHEMTDAVAAFKARLIGGEMWQSAFQKTQKLLHHRLRSS